MLKAEVNKAVLRTLGDSDGVESHESTIKLEGGVANCNAKYRVDPQTLIILCHYPLWG